MPKDEILGTKLPDSHDGKFEVTCFRNAPNHPKRNRVPVGKYRAWIVRGKICIECARRESNLRRLPQR